MRKFEDQWQERFTKFARQHDSDHLISGWSENGLRRRLAVFDKRLANQNIKVPSKILDLGCGAGTYTRFLSNLGHNVVGLDYSLQSLHRALESDPTRNSAYIGGEAYRLPFPNECFDIVISIGVLQSLAEPERALDEMSRVLRPDGLLVVEFLNACEVVAIANSALERLSGRTARVRTYSPSMVSCWLEQRNFMVVNRDGIFLPPRSIPWLGRIFDYKATGYLTEAMPLLSFAVAHAFLLTGKKINDNQREI